MVSERMAATGIVLYAPDDFDLCVDQTGQFRERVDSFICGDCDFSCVGAKNKPIVAYIQFVTGDGRDCSFDFCRSVQEGSVGNLVCTDSQGFGGRRVSVDGYGRCVEVLAKVVNVDFKESGDVDQVACVWDGIGIMVEIEVCTSGIIHQDADALVVSDDLSAELEIQLWIFVSQMDGPRFRDLVKDTCVQFLNWSERTDDK